MKVQILYEDDFIVAINKPSGVVSHKNEWTKSYETPALQLTRDQIGQHVYSIHRLDRSTSGILLFGKSKECASKQ